MALCKSFPPIEIYDMFHRLEELGGEICQSVDNWWKIETAAQESGTNLAKTTNTARFTLPCFSCKNADSCYIWQGFLNDKDCCGGGNDKP